MKFTSESLQWKNIQILQLNRGQGGVVNAMITAHGQLMYCIEDGTDEWCHSVCIDTLQHQGLCTILHGYCCVAFKLYL